MINIAIFPIPECVSFPGTVMPFHVFEPRYREMVRHCIKHNMPLAICHTQKLIHAVKLQQDIGEALRSNQSTYKPTSIFSAGKCELIEVLDDGRMLINVYFEHRYRCVEEIQTLPFRICACDIYNDLREENSTQLKLLQQQILERLMVLTRGNKQVEEILASSKWREIDPLEFSFEILALVKPEADQAQQMLEMRSAGERMQALLRLIS